jgi:hypothetical protein
MNVVTIFFLRAKSWQIFALVIGLCISGQILAAMSLIRIPPTSARHVLSVLSFVLHFQESRFGGDVQTSLFQRICWPIFLDLGLPDWRLVHPAQNQPSIRGEPLRQQDSLTLCADVCAARPNMEIHLVVAF